MRKRILALIILVAAILISWVGLYSKLRPDSIELNPYQSLGEAAARESVKLLRNSGRVLLVDADFGKYKILAPTTGAEITSFRKTIRRSGVKVAGLDKVALAPPSLARNGIFMEPGQVADLIRRHADVDAIVLFVGLAGPDELNSRAFENKPKLVLVSNYEPYYQTLAQRGAIQLAIAQRPGADAEHARNDFLVVTRDVATR